MTKKIGITCYDAWSDDLRYTDYTEVGNTYLNYVRLAGAIPILIPTNVTETELAFYAENLDGIIFTGGADIHPQNYNEPQMAGIGEIDIKRDTNDLRLMQWAFEHKLAIFGICRGCQLLNVYLGGTLFQDVRYMKTDLAHQQQSRGTVSHIVTAEKDSKLYHLFGKQDSFWINSHHHQAANKLGNKLKATLTGPDGVIEGIELLDDNHLVVGVQFHPEVFYNNNNYPYMLDALRHFLAMID